MTAATSPTRIRPATPEDAPVIARHRAGMFRDMGPVTPEAYDALVGVAEARLRETLTSGEMRFQGPLGGGRRL